MKRYVTTRRSAAGATAVTVSLVDGELAARWSEKTYIGDIEGTVRTCDSYARRALEEMKAGLEPKPLGAAS